MRSVAGKDATEDFYALHRTSVLKNPRFKSLQIGTITDKKVKKEEAGDTPYGEAFGFWRVHSPYVVEYINPINRTSNVALEHRYYKPHHHRFRNALKEILGRLITPYAEEWDKDGKVPSRKILQSLGREGVLACFIASEKKAPPLLEKWNISLPGGIRPSEYDAFHALILSEEIRVATVGCYGVTDGIIAGIGIGLPPIVKFGSPEMVERVVPQVLNGDKTICLAISEPYAGSDVQKIRTRAVRSVVFSSVTLMNSLESTILSLTHVLEYHRYKIRALVSGKCRA